MAEMPATRLSLLVRLRDLQDRDAWEAFVDLYAPAVFAFLRKQGLQEADAADLGQEILLAVADAMGSFVYTPEQGRFRSWLFTVVRHELCTFWKRKARLAHAGGDTETYRLFDELPARDADPADLWERECQQQMFAWAAAKVRAQVSASTWQAFWRTAVDGEAGAVVAGDLGLSIAAVYLAKSRVLARIRKCLQEVQED